MTKDENRIAVPETLAPIARVISKSLHFIYIVIGCVLIATFIWLFMPKSLPPQLMEKLLPAGVLASASLILTLNTRHTSIADRIRALASECYGLASNEERKEVKRVANLQSQLNLFRYRFRFTLIALSLQYLSIPVYILAFIAESTGAVSVERFLASLVFSQIVVGCLMVVIDLGLSRETIALALEPPVDSAKFITPSRIDPIHARTLLYLYEHYNQVAFVVPGAIADDDARATENYFRRYWGLQEEQFSLYRLQLLPRPVFESWALKRWRQFKSPDNFSVGTMNFLQGWDFAKVYMLDDSCRQFFDNLKSACDEHIAVIEIERIPRDL